MRIWTFQDLDVYDILQHTGIYRPVKDKCDERNHYPQFEHAYQWITEQMIHKVKPPNNDPAPIFGWYKQNGELGITNLKLPMNQYQQDMMLLELDIPDNKLVLSDYALWFDVLNNVSCIPAKSERESKIRTLLHYRGVYDISPKQYQARKEKSWKNIFCDKDPEQVDTSWRKYGFDIQATFWEIKSSMIVNATKIPESTLSWNEMR